MQRRPELESEGGEGMGQQFFHDCCNIHSCHNQPQLSQQQQPQLLLLQPQRHNFLEKKDLTTMGSI